MIYEKEIKKIIPFKIASEENKILRNKLNQGGKDLYFENYKTLMKVIEDDMKKRYTTLVD